MAVAWACAANVLRWQALPANDTDFHLRWTTISHGGGVASNSALDGYDQFARRQCCKFLKTERFPANLRIDVVIRITGRSII